LIFDQYPLNTTKYLDFIAFKQAFNLYFARADGLITLELIDQIIAIKNGMNTKRTDFTMPANHRIIINKSWLLGIIEGEGRENNIIYINIYYIILGAQALKAPPPPSVHFI